MINTKFRLSFLTLIGLFSTTQVAQAQTYQPTNRAPVSDNTLGTQVSGTGVNFDITGGLQRGGNLFHSFTDFSIPTNGVANFTNPTGNQSIITRVTGNLFSDLNGTLNSNGANFLLINPNGVVFGSGVSLNVGKAFLASTASGIDFVDAAGRNYNFGVNRAGDVPLIAIDPNIAFSPAKLIINNSTPSSKGIENYGTLITNIPGKYIALIGGNITFNGGKIVAPATIELGGLVQSGTADFSLDQGVLFPANVARGNVSLTNKSRVETGVGGGDIAIGARNVEILGGSILIGGIGPRLGIPTTVAGNIKVNATEKITVDDSVIQNRVGTGAAGKAGDVEIFARTVSVTNGAQLQTFTNGLQGDAGTIKITATDNVSFDGAKDGFKFSDTGTAKMPLNGAKDSVRFSAAFSTVFEGGTGNAGGVEISTRNLSLTNGAGLSVATFGRGDAGTIKITATDNVSFDGRKYGIGSSAASGVAKQEAGGKPGGVEISTRNLSVTNGAMLITNSFGRGDGGTVKINATENVTVNYGLIQSGVSEGAVGKGGGVEISTRNLSVTNGSSLEASTDGQGDAGNIVLKSDRIVLNKGRTRSIASTAKGGDITIIAKDFLILRNNSSISTDSASTGADGNGGNITINSPAIVATARNNDITANAVQGNGGRVNITSQGLFGIQYRPKGQASSRTNDITASSTFGRDGAVNISTPGTDPGKDSTELPNATTDASTQISQVCSASNRQNKLTVTGRGGLPPTANDPLTSDVIWQDTRAASLQPIARNPKTNPAKLAAPAVGWVFNGKGKVTLVAAGTQGQPTGTSVVCPQTK